MALAWTLIIVFVVFSEVSGNQNHRLAPLIDLFPLGTTSVRLMWSAVGILDEESILGYEAICNEEMVLNATVSEDSYDVVGLDAGTTIGCSVTAVTELGRFSSSVINTTTMDSERVPERPRIHDTSTTESTVTISWLVTDLDLQLGVTSYNVYTNGLRAENVLRYPNGAGTILDSYIGNLEASSSYDITVRAINQYGESESASTTVSTTSINCASVTCDPPPECESPEVLRVVVDAALDRCCSLYSCSCPQNETCEYCGDCNNGTVMCDAGCTECGSEPGDCRSCSDNLFLMMGRCVEDCPELGHIQVGSNGSSRWCSPVPDCVTTLLNGSILEFQHNEQFCDGEYSDCTCSFETVECHHRYCGDSTIVTERPTLSPTSSTSPPTTSPYTHVSSTVVPTVTSTPLVNTTAITTTVGPDGMWSDWGACIPLSDPSEDNDDSVFIHVPDRGQQQRTRHCAGGCDGPSVQTRLCDLLTDAPISSTSSTFRVLTEHQTTLSPTSGPESHSRHSTTFTSERMTATTPETSTPVIFAPEANVDDNKSGLFVGLAIGSVVVVVSVVLAIARAARSSQTWHLWGTSDTERRATLGMLRNPDDGSISVVNPQNNNELSSSSSQPSELETNNGYLHVSGTTKDSSTSPSIGGVTLSEATC